MPPHRPPCHANEIELDGECLPRPNLIRIFRTDTNFTFELEGVAKELLPHIEKSAGSQAEIKVEKVDPALQVTVTSVPHDAASDLVKRLQPDAPHLPD